jgi:hypothetical protein
MIARSGPDDDLNPATNSPVETDPVHEEEECGDPEGEPEEQMKDDDDDGDE